MNLGIGNVIRAKQKKLPALVSDKAWLVQDKEECFCLLLADGIPVSIAFKKAGYSAKGRSALALYNQPRIQQRVSAIFKERAATPPVSLPEITDMMKRVYAGAIHDTEYSAAYNAAFGLARLHGLVVDRAQLDVVRRPSREPDAPAEQSLVSWIAELPTLPEPGESGSLDHAFTAHSPGPGELHATASTQGPGLVIEATAFGSDLDRPDTAGTQAPISSTISTNSDALPRRRRDATGGEIENGAPTRPVTGTPHPGAFSGEGPEMDEGTSIPRAEDLF